MWRFLASGKKYRTESEIHEILERHCLPCDHYNHARQLCKVCGCCAGEKVTFMNKLAIPTESCPEGKW